MDVKITWTGPFKLEDIDPAYREDFPGWDDIDDDFFDEDEEEDPEPDPLDWRAGVHVWLTPGGGVFLVGYTHGGSTVRQQLLREILHDEALTDEWEDTYDADPTVLVGVVKVPGEGQEITEELVEGVQTLLLLDAIRNGNPVARVQAEDVDGLEVPAGLVVNNVVPKDVDVDLGLSEVIQAEDFQE